MEIGDNNRPVIKQQRLAMMVIAIINVSREASMIDMQKLTILTMLMMEIAMTC
jgi:hypothetical protein